MIAALLLMLGGMSDVPPNWTEAGRTDNVQVYVDLTSIKRVDAKTRLAWVRQQLNKPRDNGVVFYVARERFDCENEMSGLIMLNQYGDSGNLLYSEMYQPSEVQMRPKPPGTVALTALKMVCAR
ncbi:surface-adhesin E family protein [Sphingomonas sp. Leaf257]|jgi:hypothetical protein|uniref:surface-adhesin E family protein n=1 Tax=Sphingomonas sp. Leaf257 TaxID=1736309 RepID=UPI0006F40B84|nr:surface-adhesin E family protein [Sphingomonas sp. Leaf257]KQO55705.1 hypothetical protein ASF14_04975 [Sphingomonas sp. Leaf257]